MWDKLTPPLQVTSFQTSPGIGLNLEEKASLYQIGY